MWGGISYAEQQEGGDEKEMKMGMRVKRKVYN